MDRFSNWGRWGADDEQGAVNLITPEKMIRAASLVREGLSVSCAREIEFAPRLGRGEARIPPLHFMESSGEVADEDGWGSAVDWVGLPLHGLYLTHLDAHAHNFWRGKMYNNRSAHKVVTNGGALEGGVDVLKQGIFTRGVLLDVPRVRDGRVLEGDEAVTLAEIEAAEAATGTRAEAGDVVLVRTGYGSTRVHDRKRLRPYVQPGVGAECLTWVAERSPSLLATDTATDPTSAFYDQAVNSPVHTVCLVAMGMWIIDGCDLESLAETCARIGRWEFLLYLAPLRLNGGTGSPINPIAVF